jgi:hypothetical protein
MCKRSHQHEIVWPILSRAAVLAWPTAVPNNHRPATSLCGRVDCDTGAGYAYFQLQRMPCSDTPVS